MFSFFTQILLRTKIQGFYEKETLEEETYFHFEKETLEKEKYFHFEKEIHFAKETPFEKVLS